MTIYGYILPGAAFVVRSAFLAGNLSERAKQKLKILDWHKSYGKNISLNISQNISHYFIEPGHPKQNTYVETSHGVDEREFYRQGNASPLLEAMQAKIIKWQNIWNKIRPRESLNSLTPEACFRKWQTGRLPTKDVITLQTQDDGYLSEPRQLTAFVRCVKINRDG